MIPMHELGSALSPRLLGSPSLVLKTSWSEGRTPVHYGPLTAGDLYQALLSPVETSFTRLEERGRNLPFPFEGVVGNHSTTTAFFKEILQI